MDKIVIVATVYKNSKFIGYRFVNINTREVRDVTYESFKNAMKNNLFTFVNASLHSDGAIHGVNLNLSDLAKINLAYKPTDVNYCINKKLLIYLEITKVGSHVALDFGGKFISISSDMLNMYSSHFVNTKPFYNNYKVNIPNNTNNSNNDRFSKKDLVFSSVKGEKLEQTDVDINKIQDNLSGAISEQVKDKYKAFNLIEDSVVNTENGTVYKTTSDITILDINSSDELYDFKEKGKMTIGAKIALAALALRDVNYFYYSILNSLNRVIVPKENIFVKTAGASSDTIYFNAGFVDELDTSEVLFLLIHEILHIYYRHIYWVLKKNPKIYNIACDLLINKEICDEFSCSPSDGVANISSYGSYAKACGIKFPSIGGLYNPKIDLNLDTSELIYNEIYDEIEVSDEDGSTSATFRDIEIDLSKDGDIIISGDLAEEISKNGIESVRDKLTDIVNKAVASTKLAGKTLSPKIEMQLNLMNSRLVSWKKLLKDYLAKLGDVYYTYGAVNRRFMGRDIRMPGPRISEENNKKLKNIVLAIDTSGSMFSNEILNNLMNVAYNIVRTYKADGEIIFWDSDVIATAEFKDRKDLLNARLYGGGGTDVNCVFKYLDNKYSRRFDKPSLVLIMTDGYFYPVESKYLRDYKNVIWAITESDYNNFKAPNGKKAVIKL